MVKKNLASCSSKAILEVISTLLLLNSSCCYAYVKSGLTSIRRAPWTQATTPKTLLVTADEYNEQQQHRVWMYQNKHPITFEKRITGQQSQNQQEKSPPTLLLNGFGMGTFHQHRLMENLTSEGKGEYSGVVYGIDYLGHGGSWPVDCNDGTSEFEQGLRYCANTWVDQVIHFIEDVILKDEQNSNTKVHLVGNSVGGYLAGCIAAARPDLVESVVLINATPVWGLNLPFWDGHLPAPPLPKLIGRTLLDFMRKDNTMKTFLGSTYANPAAYDDDFIQEVQSCSAGRGGYAALASILWSPPAKVPLRDGTSTTDFYKCLEAIQCDVLVCFGTEDKACKRIFAKRMVERLNNRRTNASQRYIELSNVGHCANHEAPNAMSYLLNKWFTVNSKHDKHRTSIPLLTTEIRINESWGETTLQEKLVNEIPISLSDKVCDALLNLGKSAHKENPPINSSQYSVLC